MRGKLPDPGALAPAIAARGQDLADAAVKVLKDHAPVGKDGNGDRAPGTFRDSLVGTAVGTSDGATLTVASDDPVAEYIIKPTPPHEIVAREAGALAFEWHGGQVFFKRVHHPGTAGNDFAEQAADEVRQAINDILQDIVKGAL